MFRQLVYNPCVISNGLSVISHILYLFSTHNMSVWFSDLASGWTYFTAGEVWSLLGYKEGTNKAWSPTTSLIEVAIQHNFTFLPRVKLTPSSSLPADPGSINACERTSFVFLRQELPVRLSNTMKEINLLPDRLLETPSVQLVQSWWESTACLSDTPNRFLWFIVLFTDRLTCADTVFTVHISF